MTLTIPDLDWRDKSFGYPVDGWDKAKLEARALLVQAAAGRSLITYSELRDRIVSVKLPAAGDAFAGAIGLLLGQVSLDESQRLGKPMMLSAVAVTVDLVPGNGFYQLAKSLGWSDGWPEWLARVWKQYA